MNKIERKAFWKEYWEAFCKMIISIYLLFAFGITLTVVGILNYTSWKIFSIIVVMSGVILIIGIPVTIFLVLIKRYKKQRMEERK